MIVYGMSLTEQVSVTFFPALLISQAWMYATVPVTGAIMLLHGTAGLLEVLTGRFTPPTSMLNPQ